MLREVFEPLKEPIDKINNILQKDKNLRIEDLQFNPPHFMATMKMLFHAQQLIEENPTYKTRQQAIENAIIAMRKENIPADVISATIATQLADRNKNLVALMGASHMDGTLHRPNEVSADVQGIFDDGLTKAGWRVTDALISTKAEVMDSIAISKKLLKGKCDTYDNIDLIYATDTDEVAKPPPSTRLPEWLLNKLSPAPFGMQRDDISCTQSPHAESLYTPQQLNPNLLNSLRQYNQEMSNANGSTPNQKPHAPKASGR